MVPCYHSRELSLLVVVALHRTTLVVVTLLLLAYVVNSLSLYPHRWDHVDRSSLSILTFSFGPTLPLSLW
jgi:hypothetical protein